MDETVISLKPHYRLEDMTMVDGKNELNLVTISGFFPLSESVKKDIKITLKCLELWHLRFFEI